MIRFVALVLLIFVSCSDESIRSKIKDVDNIVIIDDQSKFSHAEMKREVVEGFKELLEGKAEPTECEPQGTVLFKKGDRTILRAGYYKDASACNFLIVNNGKNKDGYRLSPNALMYLGFYFQKLKKQQDARHN